jgi:exodeoxyribonuclease VII large subunit
LSRGYAMVRDADGGLVTTATGARAAAHLRLQFADGEIAATVADGPPPPRAAAKPAGTRPAAPPGRGQGELF